MGYTNPFPQLEVVRLINLQNFPAFIITKPNVDGHKLVLYNFHHNIYGISKSQTPTGLLTRSTQVLRNLFPLV